MDNFSLRQKGQFTIEFDTKIKVGALDETYTEEPLVDLTYEGGSVDYKLVVNNMGNLPYNDIQVVDILPHIGDTGVIITNVSRLSQFSIYATENITAKVVENDTVLSNVTPLVEYSQSYNPIRFSGTNFGDDTIEKDNDWTTIPPSDITEIKSIRITLDNYLLQPNQSIVIDLYGVAPFCVIENLVAWNSIAIKWRYLDENGNT